MKNKLKGTINWRMIVKIILALLLFVLFFTIIAQAQSGSKESACSSLTETMKAYIYEPLGIATTPKGC